MPNDTGMTAVLVNPAQSVGADLTPEQQAKIEEMRKELEKYGLKLTATQSKVDDPTPYLDAAQAETREQAYRLVDRAFDSADGSIIGIFPRQLGTSRRYVGIVPEAATSARKAWRFAVHYLFTSAKTGKKRNEGVKLMFAGPEAAKKIGVEPGTMLALSYIRNLDEPEIEEPAGS